MSPETWGFCYTEVLGGCTPKAAQREEDTKRRAMPPPPPKLRPFLLLSGLRMAALISALRPRAARCSSKSTEIGLFFPRVFHSRERERERERERDPGGFSSFENNPEELHGGPGQLLQKLEDMFRVPAYFETGSYQA